MTKAVQTFKLYECLYALPFYFKIVQLPSLYLNKLHYDFHMIAAFWLENRCLARILIINIFLIFLRQDLYIALAVLKLTEIDLSLPPMYWD